MRHYAARMRQRDGRWDYTVAYDRTIFAVGYCSGWVEDTAEKLIADHGEAIGEEMHRDQERLRVFQDKYHTSGHATKKEAEDCYRLFLLDNHLRLDRVQQNKQEKCKICGEWTQNLAELDHRKHWPLCAKHLSRESVESLLGEIGESWES